MIIFFIHQFKKLSSCGPCKRKSGFKNVAFLSRLSRVPVDDDCSKELEVKDGVHQGSVLSPSVMSIIQ